MAAHAVAKQLTKETFAVTRRSMQIWSPANLHAWALHVVRDPRHKDAPLPLISDVLGEMGFDKLNGF